MKRREPHVARVLPAMAGEMAGGRGAVTEEREFVEFCLCRNERRGCC